ncbi:unnamed protein product [Prorocentrum cordatum]|uniref:C2 domain-containing protein n=1 Tax=Prorocentrum cordatum TaxID=2364126 RepID=A0ABN9S4N8_9DINO|nr:unnamed protein product [Polarella glacialis]
MLGGRDTKRLVMATDEQSRTCMHLAAREGHVELVNILADKGADTEAPDRFGKTPLHWACQLGHRRTVEALLDCGARADAEDRRGCTSLHLAACSEDATICRVLLERHRRLLGRRDCHGRGPLFYAVLNAHPDAQQRATQLLLEHQAEVAEQDDYGREPLHYAAEEGRRPAVQALLRRRADPRAGDKVSGITPLQLASNEPVLRDLHAALGTPGPGHHFVPAGPARAAVIAGGCGSGRALPSRSPSPAAGRRPTAPVGPADQAAGLGPGRPLRWAEPPTQEILGAPFQVLQARFVKIMERVQQGGLDQMEHVKRPHLFTGSWMIDVSTHQQLLGQTFKYVPGPEVCLRVFNLLRPPESFPPTRGDEKDILRHYGEELDAAKPWDGADPYNTAIVKDEDDVTGARKVELLRKIQDQRQQLEAQESLVEELRRRCEQLKLELHDPESTRALRAQVHEAHRQLTVQGDELQEVQGQAKMLEATAIGLREHLQEEKGRSAELLAQQVKVRTQLEAAQKRIGWERSLEIALEQEREKLAGAQEYFQQCLRDAEAVKNGAVEALQLQVSELQEQLRAATERGQHALFVDAELEQLRREVERLKQEGTEAKDRNKKEKAAAEEWRKKCSQLEMERVEEQRAYQTKVADLQREKLALEKLVANWKDAAKKTSPVLDLLVPTSRSDQAPAEPAEFMGDVHVAIISATGLRDADGAGMGKSDPYCTCMRKGAPSTENLLRTEVQDSTLQPTWNFTGVIKGFSVKGGALLFEVRDQDPGRSDTLGRAELSMQEAWFKGNQGHFLEETLQLENAGASASATLKVIVVVVPVSATKERRAQLMGVLQDIGADFKGEVHVAMVSAAGLRNADQVLGMGGKSDPYCTCKPRLAPKKAKALKSQTIQESLDPVWNFTGQVAGVGAKGDALLFEVFDEDAASGSDKLGRAEVNLEDSWLRGGHSQEMELTLLDAGKGTTATLKVIVVVVPTDATQEKRAQLMGVLQDIGADFKGEVHVAIVSATGLRNADQVLGMGGKSDPYCTCKPRLAPKKAKALKSQTIQESLNPVWDFTGQVAGVSAKGDALLFEVFDEDAASGSDKLGRAEVNLEDGWLQGGHSQEMELTLLDAGTNITSKLNVMIVVVPAAASQDEKAKLMGILQTVGVAFKGQVHVAIVRAKGLRAADPKILGLGGKSDPYCTCRRGRASPKDKPALKTHTISKTLDPEWDFPPTVVENIAAKGDSLLFEVFDEDKINADDKLGKVDIPLKDEWLLTGYSEELTLPLQEAGKDIKAELTVKVIVIPAGAPEDLQAKLLGKLCHACVVSIHAQGLRAADWSLMGKAKSDPYVKCKIRDASDVLFKTPRSSRRSWIPNGKSATRFPLERGAAGSNSRCRTGTASRAMISWAPLRFFSVQIRAQWVSGMAHTSCHWAITERLRVS